MRDNGMPITIHIPLDLPELDVIFWLRQFTTDTLKTRYRVNYPFATLYLSKTVPYINRQAMDQSAKDSLSFPITENILEDVKEMFQEVLIWFTKENKELLYGTNDNGLLMFNSEYNKLNALYVNEYSSVKTAIKVVPTIVEIGNQVMEPGVVMYINREANGIIYREYQIKRLCRFILNFNFIPYTQFALNCFHHCEATGAILTREEIQKRLEYQKQYNTNFMY